MEPQLQFWMFQEPFKLLDINEAITRGIYLQNKSAKIHSCCLVISLTITKPSTSSDFMFVECISCQTWALRRPSRGNRPAGIRWLPVADTWPAFSTFPVRWVHHRPHSLHPKHMLQKIGGNFRKSSSKRQLAKTTEMLHMTGDMSLSFYLSPVLLLPHCWSTFLITLEKNPHQQAPAIYPPLHRAFTGRLCYLHGALYEYCIHHIEHLKLDNVWCWWTTRLTACPICQKNNGIIPA